MRLYKRSPFLLGIIFLSLYVPVFVFRIINEELFIFDGYLSYATVAAFGFIGSASVVIPLPTGLPIIADIADQNSLPLVIVAYAASAALGETTSYFLGSSFGQVKILRKIWGRTALEKLMRGRRTGPVLFVLAALPVPILPDAGGAIAGSLRYPLRRFLVAIFLGRLLKYWGEIRAWKEIEDVLNHVPLVQNGTWIWMTVAVAMVAVLLIVLQNFRGNRKQSLSEASGAGS